MIRTLYEDLLSWKNSKNRKPLVLFGARQVGKTWLLKEFGKNEYQQMAYINCDNNPALKQAFGDFNIERLIRVFSALSEINIQKETTLIILDEIQEIPLALTSLKYFCEEAPEYHIAVAGSMLGVSVHNGTGYPVRKVDELKLLPMSFKEFLMAGGKDVLLKTLEDQRWEDISVLCESYKDLLRQYYYTGGMPEVVDCYYSSHDLSETRKIQTRIIEDYYRDFSKHIPAKLLTKVRLVYSSIPAQLAKENKKFIYSILKKGSRAKDYEDAIQWLIDAGLIYKVPRISKIAMPVKNYEDPAAFKLFLNDLGLLGAMNEVPAAQILVKDNIFEEFKGSFTEQYVLQEIIASGLKPYYYSNDSSSLEIDFVTQKEKVYPIEVKAEENLKSKSLKTVIGNDTNLVGWRFSMSNYRDQKWMINVPLYSIRDWLEKAK